MNEFQKIWHDLHATGAHLQSVTTWQMHKPVISTTQYNPDEINGTRPSKNMQLLLW
jgi:hypothetical protein